MFGVYSRVHFVYVSSLTEKLRLMRIPTVELLESLPLALSVAAAHSGRISVQRMMRGERKERRLRRSTQDYFDRTIFIPLRQFCVCLPHHNRLTLSTSAPRIPNLLI